MKIAFIIILTMFSRLLFSQSVMKAKSCEEEINQANIDAKTGILRSISHGFPLYLDKEFDQFSEYFMLAEYGIESYNAGCIVFENEECYSSQMNKIILAKFGSDFFERSKNQIEKEYEIFKKSDDEYKKQYVEFDYIYTRPEKYAEYRSGRRELYKEIHRRIDLSAFDLLSPHKIIGVRLTLGQSGVIEKCQVHCDYLSREQLSDVEGVIRELANWKPATVYGFNVRSKVVSLFL